MVNTLSGAQELLAAAIMDTSVFRDKCWLYISLLNSAKYIPNNRADFFAFGRDMLWASDMLGTATGSLQKSVHGTNGSSYRNELDVCAVT